MASTAVEFRTQDGNVAAVPLKASQPLIPALVKSAVDQTVKAVTTVVQAEIRALPKQIVAAAVAQAQQAAEPAKAPTRRRESSDDEEQGPSKSQQLWNDAYDSLQDAGATAGIVRSYAETLTFAIAGEDGQESATKTSNLAADLRDPAKRQAHMRDLVMKGRDKFANDSKMAQTVGDVASFVLQARGVIDVAIRNVPQAALPWAGVCVGLQILTNPAKVSRANLAGITHVVSRMDWYCSLVDHLLDERSIVEGQEPAVMVMQRLETLVLHLYKSLLLYQMKSVSSYYRNSGLTYLRELASWDNWDADLKAITAAEEALRAASVQYNTQSSLQRLSELMQRGDKMQSTLGNIHQDLQDFISAQKEKVTDDKDSACLRDLFFVDPMRELDRLERKKDKLIDVAFSWVMGTKEFDSFSNWQKYDARRMLWIKGGPGTGKTMLLIGIVREISTQSAAFAPSVAYYFCQGTADQTRNNATAILRGLLWMLLVQQPRLIRHLRARHRYAASSLFTDSNAFSAMSEALENMLKDATMTPAYFVVDALDECDGSAGDMVQLIFKSLRLSDKVRWLVSSRPGLDLMKPGVDEAFVELDAQRLEGPVHAYITYKLSELSEVPGYEDISLLVDLSNEICDRASNTFLWAALALKELRGVEGKDAVETMKKLPSGLPALYAYMMAKMNGYDSRRQKRCRSAIAAVYLAYRPLTLRELGVIAGLGSPINPLDIVKACGSLLAMTGRVVSLVHQSARDYLRGTYSEMLERGDFVMSHQDIAHRSIDEMQHTLKHNMYYLPGNGYFPRLLGDSINGSDNDPLAGIAYSSTFWIHHLCDASGTNTPAQLVTSKRVLSFFKKYFLRWVESLSLLGKLPGALESMRMLIAQSRFQSSPPLQEFLRDAARFLITHKSTIKAAALQTYGTGLLFSPNDGSIRKFGWDERLGFIRGMITTHQTGDSNTRTLDGRYGSVTAVAFSEDGKFFSTGTEGSLTIWNTETWTPACTVFLPDSTGIAEELSFSPDSKSILAVYGDTLHVCDVETKTQTRTITHPEKHTIACANFHSDNKSVVLVLNDATVHLWDVATESMHPIFAAKGETKSIIALSPDNRVLAVSLLENLIGVWDVAAGTGHSARVLKRHDEAFRDFTFAADSKALASVSTDGTICLWDIESGTCQRSFSPGWNNWPTIALSPDLKTVAMGGLEDTTRLLDMKDWSQQEEARSHRSRIADVVVSPDKTMAATASHDRDIRIWDIERGECLHRLGGHQDAVRSVAFSPDGQTLASGSSDKTVRLWNIQSAECLQIWKGHSSAVRCIAFAPDGKTVASFSYDRTIRLWTVESGSSVPIKGQSETQSCIVFSNDSKTLASVDQTGCVVLWDTTSGDQAHVFEKESADEPVALVFTPDDSAVMMGSSNGCIYALEKASNSRRRLVNQQESFSHMAFAADGETLVTTAGSVNMGASEQSALNKKAPDNTLFVYKPVAFPGMEAEARLGHVWIEGRGVLMLLPTSYTSNVLAVCEDIVILGHASGKVTFLYFDFPKRPEMYSA
ncbi:hypothetical protein C2857_001620 [Epichloe festucae Fl1]|uniref:NACHT domain-containing protein n=1 Tax=Epichloe festucae (strain Fl1) TaxID=877507 RepID=A0A7S9KRN4_EPIFF|nr:hypothetical protein C2857_001620 [Epichloe festucae Fl1]